MASEVPSSCRPDKYLTQDNLQELFNDFKASFETHRSAEFLFASLVNNVRLAYKDPLLEAREALLQKTEDYARQLAELKLGPRMGELLPRAAVSNTGDQVTEATPSDHSGHIWPEILANTFTLYIFSNEDHHRRDWASWEAKYTDDDEYKWDLRTSLKVYKFEEPGLVKILVMTKKSPWRMMVVRDTSELDGWWREGFHFWAYDKPQPGTQMIWTGYQDRPERCILGIGDQKGMKDWEKKCEFWVPV